MTIPHDSIRRSARQLLGKVWARRDEFFPDLVCEEPADVASRVQVVRQAPEIIVENIIGFQLVRPIEIRSDVPNVGGVAVAEVAGMIDRATRTVSVARKFSYPQQRFTLAHEIGHLTLHPNLSAHRDRPFGQDRANTRKPWYEREADLFAAELLMPARLLAEVFYDCFGGAIDGSSPNNELTSKLSAVTGRELRAIDFSRESPINRATIIASVSGFGLTMFEPLAERFSVSRTAMAIRLVETGLVA